MPIENRDLMPGTRLVARYKGQGHKAEVVETEEGLRYRLQDGRAFKSPSSAGSAVMGGKACNGWRFWGLAGEAKPAQEKPKKMGGKRKKEGAGAFEHLENGRWFCRACMDGFDVADDQEPAECPQGHKADDPELATAI